MSPRINRSPDVYEQEFRSLICIYEAYYVYINPRVKCVRILPGNEQDKESSRTESILPR